jgi:uncharacterized protein (DUF2141 family)
VPGRPVRADGTVRLAAAAALAALLSVARAAEPAAAQPATATVTVKVTGVPDARGQLLVSVFTSASGWPKASRAAATARVAARAGETEVRIGRIRPGPCAVSVVHDANGNGKLDMRWFPVPRPAEATGASNDAPARFGPPAFEDARFELPADGREIRIALRR